MPLSDKGKHYLIDSRVTLGIVGDSGLTSKKTTLAGTQSMVLNITPRTLISLIAFWRSGAKPVSDQYCRVLPNFGDKISAGRDFRIRSHTGVFIDFSMSGERQTYLSLLGIFSLHLWDIFCITTASGCKDFGC